MLGRQMSNLLSILLAVFAAAAAEPQLRATPTGTTPSLSVASAKTFAEQSPRFLSRASRPLDTAVLLRMSRSSVAEVTTDELSLDMQAAAIDRQTLPLMRCRGSRQHADPAASFLSCRRLPLRC